MQNFQKKEKNENTIFIESIPFQFGYSKYNAKNYPYSDLYTIKINRAEVEKVVKLKYPSKDEIFYRNQTDVEINSINQNLPLKVVISRDYDESKEILKIESVEDSEGNDKSIKYFSLSCCAKVRISSSGISSSLYSLKSVFNRSSIISSYLSLLKLLGLL